MKIIIPMSGQGERFVAAGYSEIKPLISIETKPMIGHVVEMFPSGDFVFVCNKDHLSKTNLGKVLEQIAPRGKIIGIEKHKFGPVFAALQAKQFIEDEEEVIVNYCDFKAKWSFGDFKNFLKKNPCDGIVTSYTGFHPHLLWPNLYAGMRVSDDKKVLEIKEKHSFTENKMDSFHSAGTYYFRKGKDLKKYFTELMDKKITVNSEYYVSSVYDLMIKDQKKILAYEVEQFLQWGTPQDLEEYLYWAGHFSLRSTKKPFLQKTTLLVPMAGTGERFLMAGYKIPKPLIEVDGKPMFVRAIESLPSTDSKVFICLKEHVEKNGLDRIIKKFYPQAKIIVTEKTHGQAASCMLAENQIDTNSSILIASCDNEVFFDSDKFEELADKTDALVWTFRNNPAVKRKPESYGWVKTDEKTNVVFVSCKKPVSDAPIKDHAVTGIFYFKKAGRFFEAVREMTGKNLRINNEFYVDTVPNIVVENKGSAKVFEVIDYTVFGTPQDLETYKYWGKYFRIQGA